MDFGLGAPLLILLASALVVLLLLALQGRLPGARLDHARTVLVHAGDERVWDFVRRLPDLHTRHGKTRDFGRISEWTLRQGDGESQGSVWRAHGTWGRSPYWADVEILRTVPGKTLDIRLRHDSLGTQRGLRDHIGSLSLEAVGPDATKITWRLRARLHRPGLLWARLLSPAALRARLFDQGLRSLKSEIDNLTQDEVALPAVPAGTAGSLTVPAPTRPARRPPETTA